MIRVLTKSIEGYDLRVQGFNDWSKALLELKIGECKIVLTSKLRPIYDSMGNPISINFPQKLDNTRERIIVLLLLIYPNGLTQETIHNIVGSQTKTVRNWLTESSKGIADYFEKTGEKYAIKLDSLYWALDEFEIILKSLN